MKPWPPVLNCVGRGRWVKGTLLQCRHPYSDVSWSPQASAAPLGPSPTVTGPPLRPEASSQATQGSESVCLSCLLLPWSFSPGKERGWEVLLTHRL